MTSMNLKLTLAYVLPVSAAAALTVYLLAGRMVYVRRKLQFTVDRQKKSFLTRLTDKLLCRDFMKLPLNYLAVRISMFTGYSRKRNLELACAVFIGGVFSTIIALCLILPRAVLAWYVILMYLAAILLFVMVVFHVFTRVAVMHFTGNLPETFKLLNSRYISKGNILKAISISMEDFDSAVKREMVRIYDVLRKNNMREIEATFRMIEDTYKNEYLTLLLALIKHAHYKGGNEVIKQQFEQATEEVLLEIENHKDLSVTSRAYIFLAMATPPLMWGIERFNTVSLGEKALLFYRGAGGIQILVVYLAALIGFIAYLLFLERTT